MAKITFHPLGNADCARIDLDNGKKILIDYANMHRDGDKYVDLPTVLRDDLRAAKRDNFDVVVFSHMDSDHVSGAEEFFYFEHSQQYQGEGRIKIDQMWVPAAVITESRNDLCDSAYVVQAEARHRLKTGEGILVFSQPGCVEGWLRKQGIAPETRSHLMVDAGTLVPGFSLAYDNVEFFVHSPFASHLDGRAGMVVRNDDAIAFMAHFDYDGRATRAFFTADIAYEVLGNIVEISEYKGNEHRLEWDILKLPHHTSYKSIGPDKGRDKTEPTDEIERLYAQYGQQFGKIISTSDPIPTEDTVQPPHRQAAAYYREKAKALSGEYLVTLEHPSISTPRVMVIEIDRFGTTLQKGVAAGSTLATDSNAPRAG
ncbi:hypothetical protein [Deinococcus sp. SL84]|uniref:hypothetical protein n=1 Tax=Deinococcus sp. SL84 TaxID=2994663 RepID=UPI0022759B58|nr:hypothetical protein [Deinococcus sp. SL84]MCY1703698.1 hypothetical protein [Deinococcus sp. SL84]